MAVHILVDGHDQFLHITKDATAEAVLGKVTEESLDQGVYRAARCAPPF